MKKPRSTAVAVFAMVVLIAFGVGVANAQIPALDGTITACLVKTSGAVSIIDPSTTRCPKSTTSLTWAQKGTKGDPGAQGVQGVPGPAGPKGDPGVSALPDAYTAVLGDYNSVGVPLASVTRSVMTFYSPLPDGNYLLTFTGTFFDPDPPDGATVDCFLINDFRGPNQSTWIHAQQSVPGQSGADRLGYEATVGISAIVTVSQGRQFTIACNSSDSESDRGDMRDMRLNAVQVGAVNRSPA